MPQWLYVPMCVLVPCLIGLAVYGLFELWDRRQARTRPDAPPVTIDYLI